MTGSISLVYDERGHRWVFQVKASSQPGRVADTARRMRDLRRDDTIPVLVVPHMTPAGARAAEEAGHSWIDLSSNAHIRSEDLYVRVQGRPNLFRSRGRPSSPFAPKSARVTRVLLEDPGRWWRQKELVTATGLDDGSVSRIVRRLDEELLLERRERELRPRGSRGRASCAPATPTACWTPGRRTTASPTTTSLPATSAATGSSSRATSHSD